VLRLTALIFVFAFAAIGCRQDKAMPKTEIKQVTIEGLTSMEFVQISRGTFRMGSEQSAVASPVHKVALDTYEIMTTEVTNKQFEQFAKRDRAPESQQDDGPVCGVSKKMAMKFAEWLTSKDDYRYSLPTEAQWEYAARGGLQGMDFPWGNHADQSLALTEGEQATVVKSYPPNAYGIYDMCGNAREICLDDLGDYTASPKTNPVGSVEYDLYITRGLGVGTPLSPWIWYRKMETESPGDTGRGFRLVRVSKKVK